VAGDLEGGGSFIHKHGSRISGQEGAHGQPRAGARPERRQAARGLALHALCRAQETGLHKSAFFTDTFIPPLEIPVLRVSSSQSSTDLARSCLPKLTRGRACLPKSTDVHVCWFRIQMSSQLSAMPSVRPASVGVLSALRVCLSSSWESVRLSLRPVCIVVAGHHAGGDRLAEAHRQGIEERRLLRQSGLGCAH